MRGPHRAEAEGVADVRVRHKRVPLQAAHNGHGRIHGGIPYRNSSRGMPELPEAPLGEDKSKTRRTEPSDLSAAPRGEQWKSRNGGADEKGPRYVPGRPRGPLRRGRLNGGSAPTVGCGAA